MPDARQLETVVVICGRCYRAPRHDKGNEEKKKGRQRLTGQRDTAGV